MEDLLGDYRLKGQLTKEVYQGGKCPALEKEMSL